MLQTTDIPCQIAMSRVGSTTLQMQEVFELSPVYCLPDVGVGCPGVPDGIAGIGGAAPLFKDGSIGGGGSSPLSCHKKQQNNFLKQILNLIIVCNEITSSLQAAGSNHYDFFHQFLILKRLTSNFLNACTFQ